MNDQILIRAKIKIRHCNYLRMEQSSHFLYPPGTACAPEAGGLRGLIFVYRKL